MKTILGLDLGTNSIGWALIEQNFENKYGNILGMGTRVIPMSQDILSDFGKGNSVSQTAERTRYRSTRRLHEKYLLRRERLHRVLNVLEFLPENYAFQIDFEKRFGKFKENTEPKIAYHKKNNAEQNKQEYDFLFKKSFLEMVEDFRKNNPQILADENGQLKLIPYDWTIYYLRKKALTYKIEKEELSWLLLNFNQKRGYYQLRGEDEETTDNKEYVISLKIIQIEKGDNDKKNDKKKWYNMTLENGWIYSATFSSEPLWLNTEKEFLIAEELDENGKVKIVKEKRGDKNGKEKRRITPLPSFEEIDLMTKKDQDKIYKKIKVKTEITISNSGNTVGAYIYETLLQNPKQKIRGKLIRTIERKFYKDELYQILKKQKEFHPELKSENLYNDCVRELYRNNESHQSLLSKKDFIHLFVDDIIFYQRPLRSKKSSISNCTLEYRKYKDENDLEHLQYLKAIPKSNPYYQEFRTWQWMYNLSIYKKSNDTNITTDFLSTKEDYEKLFDFLDNRKEIEQKPLLKYFLEQKGLKGKQLNAEVEKYRWNYVEDKPYPCNKTKKVILSCLDKNHVIDISQRDQIKIWHLLYSITSKEEMNNALNQNDKRSQKKDNTSKFEVYKFLLNKGFNNDEIEKLKKVYFDEKDYGSFSEKAIKKLLPLLRMGKYWNWDAINEKSKQTIEKILTGEYDINIKDRVREKAIHLTEQDHFQGLQLWLAQYIVYGRHSEAAIAGRWNSVSDLEKYLQDFKQHSLRNPIVEQVITETLRVVKDIWIQYGNGSKDFLNEIHIELGREMKKTADERKNLTNQMSENENTNLRIKALLAEMMYDAQVENVRPYSPMQQEILKVYEEGVLNSEIEIEDEILKISKTAQPSSSDLKRYKLWLEQKYCSPYTGEIIPLNKLFTTEYEIEHIIPQSLFFDDGFNNKVICESAVNKLKDNQIGLSFIKNHHGEKVELGTGKSAQILEVKDYEDFVKKHYAKNRSKRNKLLMEEIPERMIERQLNDTRYISKFISSALSNIVRAETNDDGLNSKNLIPGNGKITNELKQDWGLNDVWNDLILPRFERLNQLMNATHFTAWNDNHQKFLPTIPIELSKGFSKKRIDHRHHALDALVIACATRDHINLLNNKYAKSRERFDLNRKLRVFQKVVFNHPQTRERIEKDVPQNFIKPWDSFTSDTKKNLDNIVVSFKQNLRVINKAINYYEKWDEKNGIKAKELKEQKGKNWAIRKPLHKETVSGKVDLKRIKVPKGKILTATRKSINTSLNLNTIESITDTGIQKILKNYLASKDNNPELAFSPEGIEDMNKNIEKYNDGKHHQPILKARIFELGSKFPLGHSGNKEAKYVEAAQGTNLFFGIYQSEAGSRVYETIPFNVIVERQKQGLTATPFVNDSGDKLLFHLSPNDYVYIPTEDELGAGDEIDFSKITSKQIQRLYMVNDFSGTCYFTPNRFAKSIAPKEVDLNFDKIKNKITGSYSHKTASLDGIQIKEVCIKVNIDRLGNIIPSKATNYNPTPEITNIVSEPEAAYKKSSFQTFNSHEEANEADAKARAALSPEQHLANATQMIKAMYAEELKNQWIKHYILEKMLDIYIEEHRQILFALIKHKVDFMLIGGYAVIHYGYDRGTGDMDIWLQTGNENRDKLIEALKDFNIIDEHIETLKKMDFTNPVPVFFFGEQPRQIDFLTAVSNLKFEEAIIEVNYFPLEDIKIPVIQYHHLIDTKKNTGRIKDKADIEELEKINKYRKE